MRLTDQLAALTQAIHNKREPKHAAPTKTTKRYPLSPEAKAAILERPDQTRWARYTLSQSSAAVKYGVPYKVIGDIRYYARRRAKK